MKILYIILDGLGDRPIKALGNKTPLEAAKKQHFDELAAKSKLGLLYAIQKDLAPESDAASFALFGYDPFKYYRGRGPMEALGAGIKIKKGDVVMRCNFASESAGLIRDVEAVLTEEQ